MTTQSINLNASGYPLHSANHNGCRNTGIHHVGLHAKDPSASTEFYRDLLNMQIVGGSGPEDPLGATAFLCSRPDEESDEIALFAKPVLVHVAFKVSSLAELRSLHTRVVERGIPIKLRSWVSFSFYFDDPIDLSINNAIPSQLKWAVYLLVTRSGLQCCAGSKRSNSRSRRHRDSTVCSCP